MGSDVRTKKGKVKVFVTSRHGRFPFQTGLVTAALLRRGLTMADAIATARAVRDRIEARRDKEVTTEQVGVVIHDVVLEKLGPEAAKAVKAADVKPPLVQTTHGTFPFSEHNVLRDLDTAGVPLEEAMRLVTRLEDRVKELDASAVSETLVHREMEQLLVYEATEDVVRRFRLTNWVANSRAPVIILIGGATGTGKSTLAMELAYRLGVVWIVSTDMVRETMRAILSPTLVPGLHDHSFRGMVVGGQVLSDPRERVLVGFRQQTSQVAVGVRAVIQRAIYENANIIIEGTHIVPPFEQYMPPGATAHMAGFVLTVPDEAQHRRRFPERSNRQPARSAGVYLDAFQSVRWIHEDTLRQAEEAETVVLSNSDLNKTLRAAVDILSRGLPVDEPPGTASMPPRAPRRDMVPTLLLLLDGLGDEPSSALANKTPLEAAHLPHLRRLAHAAGQGQIQTARIAGRVPSTDEGTLALLCPETGVKLGRGVLEALGEGVPVPSDAVVFRGNLATVDPDGAIVDRRAGRIRDGVADLVAPLAHVPLSRGIIARVYAGHEHRIVVTLIGPGLSPLVCDTDPSDSVAAGRVQVPLPLESSPEAARTAEALAEFLQIARKKLSAHPLNASRLAQGLLPANMILTRGASALPRRRTSRLDGVLIGRCSTARGIARYLGLRTITTPQMTGNLDTDLDAKFHAAHQALMETDLAIVHVKGTDIAAHDRRPLEKANFLSSVDQALGRFLEEWPDERGKLRVVVAADHGTSSVTGEHLPDPVPLLLASWPTEGTEQAEFSEKSSAQGALGLLRPGELPVLLGLTTEKPRPLRE